MRYANDVEPFDRLTDDSFDRSTADLLSCVILCVIHSLVRYANGVEPFGRLTDDSFDRSTADLLSCVILYVIHSLLQ